MRFAGWPLRQSEGRCNDWSSVRVAGRRCGYLVIGIGGHDFAGRWVCRYWISYLHEQNICLEDEYAFIVKLILIDRAVIKPTLHCGFVLTQPRICLFVNSSKSRIVYWSKLYYQLYPLWPASSLWQCTHCLFSLSPFTLHWHGTPTRVEASLAASASVTSFVELGIIKSDLRACSMA
jgi:hypothetical protein